MIPHRKRTLFVVALVLAALAGSLYLIAGCTLQRQSTTSVWQNFLSGDYSIKFPPGWTFRPIDSARTGFFAPGKQTDLSLEYVGDIVIEVLLNPSQLDLNNYYRSVGPVDLFVNSQTNTPFVANGFPAVKFIGVFGMIPTDLIAVNKTGVVIEISDVGQLHETDGVLDLMASSIR